MRPFIERLRHEVDETVDLAVLNGIGSTEQHQVNASRRSAVFDSCKGCLRCCLAVSSTCCAWLTLSSRYRLGNIW